ncbi:MAG TPA: type II toxin-antitoxin system RelE/ParE family toxin [Candidatus Angelobacter sp.]|nr:type II toxin-antitoxin system RelE/ParE family toxin [Candidatus Angelobacter sp.]
MATFSSKRIEKPMARPNPEYQLTEAADQDLLAIARYTIRKWGVEQARRYEAILEDCFSAIAKGKIRPRVFLKRRPELLFTHCEHHYVFYVIKDDGWPLVIAVLHENMNLVARLKQRFSE